MATSTVNVTIVTMTDPTGSGNTTGTCTCTLSLADGNDPNIKIVNDSSTTQPTVISVKAAQGTPVQILFAFAAGYSFAGYTNLSIDSVALKTPQISVLPQNQGVGLNDLNSLPAGQAYTYMLNIKAKPTNGGTNTYVWDPGIENENLIRPVSG